ncbi:MAG: RluA family pseudouridine synthase [Armatimonadetes bacterium]|nr:RluA family pseudouridine synthase [Armatimonadota bacterium]
MPDYSRTKLAGLATEGAVRVDGTPRKPSFLVLPGMVVELDEPPAQAAHDLTPAEIPLEVLFEDEFLLVVNKPRGLATHPAPSLKEPSLVNALLARSHSLSQAGGAFRPGIVHRLDKETTGLIMVAKDDTTHARLARQIEKKTAERRYLAVIAGLFDHERLTVNAPIARSKTNRLKMAIDQKGKAAVTHFKRLESRGRTTLVGARLETGRTHQIRIHLQSLGYPVLGDRLYAPKGIAEGPMQLHAAYLRFEHPRSGEVIDLWQAPPADFGFNATEFEDQLRNW